MGQSILCILYGKLYSWEGLTKSLMGTQWVSSRNSYNNCSMLLSSLKISSVPGNIQKKRLVLEVQKYTIYHDGAEILSQLLVSWELCRYLPPPSSRQRSGQHLGNRWAATLLSYLNQSFWHQLKHFQYCISF